MRKKVVLFAFLGFIISVGAGYYYIADRFKDENKDEKHEARTVSSEKTAIEKGGAIIYQYYYTKDGVTKEQLEPVPDFLEGITMDELKNIYNDWQILYFSPKKVVLRCSVEGKSDEVFLLRDYNGCVAIFEENSEKNMKLKEQTGVAVSLLPETEQEQLNEGIYILGEENLVKLLSDYSS